MSLQTISYILYALAFLLLTYVLVKVRSEGFKVGDAIAVLAIIVMILIALNIPKPSNFGDISGAWSGTGKVETPDGIFDATMTITISSDCREGDTCGQAFFPAVSCSITLEYIGEKDGRFYFNQVGHSDSCGNAIETYLEPIGNSKVKYYAKGDWGETNIILEHQ